MWCVIIGQRDTLLVFFLNMDLIERPIAGKSPIMVRRIYKSLYINKPFPRR